MASSPRPSRVLLAALTALAACTGASPSISPPPAIPAPPAAARLPGPAGAAPVRRPEEAIALNASCERCHADIAAEWRASQHRVSFTEPFFQRSLAIEPLPFCRGCHAPEANPELVPQPPIAEMGVGCVTCHVPGGGAVLAAAHEGAAPAKTGGSCALPVERDARFATAAACASCHEFNFPDDGLRATPEKMQSTASEHLASPYAAVSCATCHMPPVAGASGQHRSHAFASSDAARVRAAVRVQASREGASARISIDAGGVGHAFPTGDLFRRIEVSAEAVGSEQQVIASTRRYLTRHFGLARPRGVIVKKLLADDRINPSSPRVVDLDLGPAAARASIVYRVSYQRVEHPREVGSDDAVIGGEVVLAEGTLPPPGDPR